MKIHTLFITVLVALLTISAGAFAAKPPGAGNGGGSGGGAEPPDYGDLFVLYRDDYGLPILTPAVPEGGLCQQPISAMPFDGCVTTPGGECLLPVEPTTCAVSAGYELYTQEIDFGRTNEARSPDSVFDEQLQDAIFKLATADCVTLDPAGRLVTSIVADDGSVLTAAIDSPLQNLAIYKQLMLMGYLGPASNPMVLPGGDFLDTAARAMGAASDKAGFVGKDMIVYINQTLGLVDPGVTTALGATLCVQAREEVAGVMQLVDICVLNYGAYAYDRTANFGVLPNPAYIPAVSPTDGWFEYLSEYSISPLLFQIAEGPVTAAVFADAPFVDGNIDGFAQAADDARAVIDFMHSHPVPLGYETPLLCQASTDTGYDVSISAVSGLQVPVRMVAGTEGREFTVTVANAGPDAASGSVEVFARDSDGIDIPTFPRSYGFNLVAGTSQSWTEGFSIDYKTTITWTATAVPDCGTCDVNPVNNSVTEITVVTGGGGGRQ